MPKSKPFRGPVVVSGRTFATKKSLGSYVEHMRDTNNINQRFMLGLLRFHATYDKKLNGRSVLKFILNSVGDGFMIVFTNGDVSSVSFRKLIKNVWQTYGKSPEEKARVYEKNRLQSLVLDFKHAARYEVNDQVKRFRVHKASANPKFSNGKAWHVGHDYESAKRFEELLEDFFREQPADARVHLEAVEKGGYLVKWADRDLAEAWQAYHKEHAVLRMETKRENLCGNRGFATKMNWAKERVVGYVNED